MNSSYTNKNLGDSISYIVKQISKKLPIPIYTPLETSLW